MSEKTLSHLLQVRSFFLSEPTQGIDPTALAREFDGFTPESPLDLSGKTYLNVERKTNS